jgi:hypothetical protein
MAMLGFAGIAVTELTSKVPAAEQLAGDVIGVALLSLTFTLASIVPKFNTGRSLQVRRERAWRRCRQQQQQEVACAIAAAAAGWLAHTPHTCMQTHTRPASPTQELHAKATGDNLKGEGVAQALVLFDTNTELWTGRVAMLGLTGLFAVEAITGKVFF